MAGGGEIQLAERIIQRVQSLLTGKEAARTAVVSKSWHSAWLTRPNLDFDDSYFRVRPIDPSGFDRFSKYAKKTMKRYEQSNLKVESFKLCMKTDQCGCADLAYKLILKALRIGVTRLCVRLSNTNNMSFVLPNEVFGADNLVELSLNGCTIKLDDGVVIKCSRLESLSLDDVHGITIDTVSKIVSRCPSIEKFSLMSDIYEDYEYKYGHRAAARKASATAMTVGVFDNLIRLRCLVLGYESFKVLCLGDLLSRFPFLKDLTVYLTHDSTNFEEGIRISNRSLERIKLALALHRYGDMKLRVKVDVPSVRKFTYEGPVIPCLSFKSTPPSREWESHVSIKHREDDFSTWFNALSELLTELSQSKTHLSLDVGHAKVCFDYQVRDNIIQRLRNHELENLMIDMTGLPSLSCYAFFDGLFRLCRPKLITQYYKDVPDKRRYDDSDMEKTNIDFLCQTLEEGINLKVSRPTQFMYGLKDLEEVNAQACDMDIVPAVWKPIPFESLLDADAPDEHMQIVKQRIRLLLKWKPS